MAGQFFFLLGLANNILLILIFLIRKNHVAFLQSYGWVYLLLAVPAVYLIFLVQRDEKALQYSIFLGMFLAFLALEGLYDFILRIPFRETWNWKLLTPYLVCYFSMNYGFVVMVWKSSIEKGLILLALFVVQIVANIVTH
jgi:hypothetical protein